MHVKPPTASTHVLPNVHGLLAHSSTLMRQSGPRNPRGQTHVKKLTPSTQLPPL